MVRGIVDVNVEKNSFSVKATREWTLNGKEDEEEEEVEN